MNYTIKVWKLICVAHAERDDVETGSRSQKKNKTDVHMSRVQRVRKLTIGFNLVTVGGGIGS